MKGCSYVSYAKREEERQVCGHEFGMGTNLGLRCLKGHGNIRVLVHIVDAIKSRDHVATQRVRQCSPQSCRSHLLSSFWIHEALVHKVSTIPTFESVYLSGFLGFRLLSSTALYCNYRPYHHECRHLPPIPTHTKNHSMSRIAISARNRRERGR